MTRSPPAGKQPHLLFYFYHLVYIQPTPQEYIPTYTQGFSGSPWPSGDLLPPELSSWTSMLNINRCSTLFPYVFNTDTPNPVLIFATASPNHPCCPCPPKFNQAESRGFVYDVCGIWLIYQAIEYRRVSAVAHIYILKFSQIHRPLQSHQKDLTFLVICGFKDNAIVTQKRCS